MGETQEAGIPRIHTVLILIGMAVVGVGTGLFFNNADDFYRHVTGQCDGEGSCDLYTWLQSWFPGIIEPAIWAVLPSIGAAFLIRRQCEKMRLTSWWMPTIIGAVYGVLFVIAFMFLFVTFIVLIIPSGDVNSSFDFGAFLLDMVSSFLSIFRLAIIPGATGGAAAALFMRAMYPGGLVAQGGEADDQ